MAWFRLTKTWPAQGTTSTVVYVTRDYQHWCVALKNDKRGLTLEPLDSKPAELPSLPAEPKFVDHAHIFLKRRSYYCDGEQGYAPGVYQLIAL